MIISRFASIGNMADGSTFYRVAIWMGTISMLKDYWLSGIGPGTDAFNMIYPSYSYNTATAQHSHNLFCRLSAMRASALFCIYNPADRIYPGALFGDFEGDRPDQQDFSDFISVQRGRFYGSEHGGLFFYNYRVMFLFWVFIGLSALALIRRSSLPESVVQRGDGKRPERQFLGVKTQKTDEEGR